MPNHCKGCHGHIYDEFRNSDPCDEHGMDDDRPDCPGCQECERLRAAHDGAQESALENLGRFLRMAKSCEQLRTELESERKESAYWRNVEATTLALDNIFLRKECERLRAELLSVRETLLRERAGQGKCNAGHVSDRALWDCPVCVEAMRARLTKAERVIRAIREHDIAKSALTNITAYTDEQLMKWGQEMKRVCDELCQAMTAWEDANG